MIHALFATGRNGEMGMKDGSLPWRTAENTIRPDLPEKIRNQCVEDMALFKSLTTGNIVIMGYNTYKTFPCPLPNRTNIVIDRNAEVKNYFTENEWNFFRTLEDALSACESYKRAHDTEQKDIYIIGGAKLLKEAFEKKLITGNTYHNVIDFDFPESTVFFQDSQK